jgi:hypothetical protein
MVVPDSLHICDHHGTIGATIANAIAGMLDCRELAPTHEGSLRVLNRSLSQFYKDTKCEHRIGDFRLTNIFGGHDVHNHL